MDQAAYDKTLATGLVTFFSRTKNRLWTKGETSGNTLELKRMWIDCDQDSLLITVKANGPTCHTKSQLFLYGSGGAQCYTNWNRPSKRRLTQRKQNPIRTI
ncbi:hypothetical protein OVA29_04960 [Exiguobacterium sp. SL14]|nr:phosphoribosyl-AMP cyclohydrolase [Exiguobacterium sp. SL14]MCY1690222.1 hypothetical protein [Exiguobacterium sp. SL14]